MGNHGQAVLESSRVRVRQCLGHSVLHTPALVHIYISTLVNDLLPYLDDDLEVKVTD